MKRLLKTRQLASILPPIDDDENHTSLGAPDSTFDFIIQKQKKKLFLMV